MRRVVVFSVFLNVGSVLVIAKTLTYVAVRVPLLGLIKGLWLRLLKPYQTGLKKNFSSESIKEPEPKILSEAVLSNIFYKVLWLYQRSYSTRGAKSEAIINWPLVFLASICLVTAEHNLEFSHATCQIYCMKKKLAKFESEVLCNALLLLDGHHALADHKQTDTSTWVLPDNHGFQGIA